MSVLDGLPARTRLGVAALITAGFGLILLAPLALGAGAFLDGWSSFREAAAAEAQVRSRLDAFEARRAEAMAAQSMGDAELALYLDADATQQGFNDALTGLVNALRDQGLVVSGDAAIHSGSADAAVTALSADLIVDGSLNVILETLSQPEFSRLRTQTARFSATSVDGEVRAILRFVAYHAAGGDEGAQDAR